MFCYEEEKKRKKIFMKKHTKTRNKIVLFPYDDLGQHKEYKMPRLEECIRYRYKMIQFPKINLVSEN